MKEGIPEFKTYSERPITDREYLGGGRYGDVFKVKYTTGEANPEKGKKGFKYFAEKKFKTFSEAGSLAGFPMGSNLTSGRESAKKSVVVHSQLKELGIPTWTTYRLSGSHSPDKVLMSLKGAEEDAFLILPNNKKEIPGIESDHQRLTKSKVDKIENLESVVNTYIDIFANLEKAVNISENDSVGIVYEKEVGKIEVLFADLDSVSVVNPEPSKWEHDKYFQSNNMGVLQYHVIGNIKKFVEEYMDDENEKKQEYLQLLNEKMNEAKKKAREFPEDPSQKDFNDLQVISSVFREKLNIDHSFERNSLKSNHGDVVKVTEKVGRYNYGEPTKYGKSYIFKLGVPETLSQYEKEKWCIEKATQAGIPTSKCLQVGEEQKRGRAYLVLEYLEGKIGNEAGINPEQIYKKLGEYAKIINNIPVNCYGEGLDKQVDSFKDNWREVVDVDINNLFADNFFVDNKILTDEQVDSLKKRLSEMYDWKFTPTLCHANLNPENTVVSPDGTINVVGWGNVEGHRAPHFELAGLLAQDTKSEYVDEFVKGYGINQSQFEEIQHDVNTLVILRILKNIKLSIQTKKDNGQDFIQQSVTRLNNLG